MVNLEIQFIAEGKMAKNSSKKIKKESKTSKHNEDDVADDIYVGSYNSFAKATHPSTSTSY